jgi:hypothetical protein
MSLFFTTVVALKVFHSANGVVLHFDNNHGVTRDAIGGDALSGDAPN